MWAGCRVGSVGAAGLPWPAGWWLVRLAGGAAAGSSLLTPSASAPVGGSGCCGRWVGSRPGGRETGGGGDKARERKWRERGEVKEMGGNDSAREGRREERGEGVGVSRGKPRQRHEEGRVGWATDGRE